MPTIEAFWEELKDAYGGEDIHKMFTIPEKCYRGSVLGLPLVSKDEHIYRIETKEDYIFDDAFWDVFHEYPFHVCHISWRKHELCFKIITESEKK